MSTNRKYIEERDSAEYHRIATEIMFRLFQSENEFSADDFYRLARREAMPPDLIKRYSGSMFRQFQAAGYIEKTDRFILSERNGSTPLPVWKSSGEETN
jgi:hypothetical protein